MLPTRNTVTSHGRERKKKKKNKVAVLRRAARRGNSRTGAIAGENATFPRCTRCTARVAPDVDDSRGETILCIKQKAAQYDIPRVSYLRFVHISSVSHTWRDHIGIRRPTAVYTMRAIFLLLFTCIGMCTGATVARADRILLS